ncbi:hypothetical protein NUU61_003344 [Penicillium alfredii]|uniref:NmrA-like domain-containing protein n=1 Tax=Penicillium alfredii TaxID=1506179 RepID=A0A9W9FUJ5_9EURO|nr:uncharacterized protein NUU61_003344 [Penicillium alfredii]KAJ5105997.1 hypothetical protein NUU61_003344 [Penicillium alfredii]
MAGNYVKNQAPGFINQIRRVAMVGAGGSVGKPIAQEVLKTGKHTLTALTRVGSQNTLPEGIQSVSVDYNDEASLMSALKDQDCLIITLAVTAPSDTQLKLVQAAAKAGVKYVMPNIWGCDVTNEGLANDVPGWNRMPAVAAEMEKAGIAWIGVICGFWYEHSVTLGPDAFGFNFVEKKLTLCDDGNTKINISTQTQCGRAVATILSLPVLPQDEDDQSLTVARWLNKQVFISSFLLSQKDMFESWKRVTGDQDSDWTIEYEPSSQRHQRGVERVKQGDFSKYPLTMYSRVLFPNGGGNFESTHELANSLLGLPMEDLDEQTKKAKVMVDRGYNYMTNRN